VLGVGGEGNGDGQGGSSGWVLFQEVVGGDWQAAMRRMHLQVSPYSPRDYTCIRRHGCRVGGDQRSLAIRSRRISLMRVRCPSPLDFSQSSTSLSMRREICVLRGR